LQPHFAGKDHPKLATEWVTGTSIKWMWTWSQSEIVYRTFSDQKDFNQRQGDHKSMDLDYRKQQKIGVQKPQNGLQGHQ
jgi:hypothetical protein